MISNHPVNGAIRFLLELGAITTFAVWGFHQAESGTGILLAILMPVSFAVVWGVFAVKDDPSRSGKTVVPTPGIIRLLLELFLFAAATWMLRDLGYLKVWWIFGGITLIHYIISYDRVLWLLKQK